MLSKYWPDNTQVANCIRTEAEELSPYVLQVVHEPMRLKEININTGDSKHIVDNAENALLTHLKRHNRPIPILGDAGSGKSHLIRLLDVQLQNDPETQDWIVKRIPKSSSLRQVLEILLDGMEGDSFDKLRIKIRDVGNKLKTEYVAAHLILFMGERLEELLDSTNEKIQDIRASGGIISEEDAAELRRIKQHAPKDKLPSLLGDSNFKESLINPGCCLYNIAKRITSGSTDNEISENEYKIKETDLDFSKLHIPDFSNNAQQYITKQQLNTNFDKRIEVVDLLNKILSDSCRKAFTQLFHFNSGQFQDLFLDIRKELLGKTMVVLVEDMAAITAIENDLIDSLLLESTRDGKQTLCDVKSAIAVTTGYQGYQRRRNTIATRSGAIEWHIDKYSENEFDIYQRVQNFCGRYLNASRYSLEEIINEVEAKNLPLKAWHDSSLDKDLQEDLKSFGVSNQNYSLFPYNSSALKALTDYNCRNTSGELEFNPRTVLSHILIPILRDYRDQYLQGLFPPGNLLGLSPSANLQSQLRINDPNKEQQSFAAVSFWGYQATTINNLVSLMPPAIATHMGLKELSCILGDTTAEPQKTTEKSQTLAPTPRPNTETALTPNLEPDSVNRSSEVDLAFERGHIDQKLANIIRAELLDILKCEFKYAQKWNGVNFNLNDYLKSGKTTYISIPYNSNNPNKYYIEFGNENIFKDPFENLKYRQFITAILMRIDNNGWDKSLYVNYCHYKNFTKSWIDEAIPTIVTKIQRENLLAGLKEAAEIASIIHPLFISSNNEEKLNILCSHSEHWHENLTSNTGHADWDAYKNTLISKWNDKRKGWIKFVAHNNHAISRDLVIRDLKKVDTKNISNPVALRTQREISSEYLSIFTPLEGCNNKDSFIDLFKELSFLVTKMKNHDRFLSPFPDITALKLINKINKIIDSDLASKHWTASSKLLKIIGPFNFEQFIKSISQFNGSDLRPVTELLQIWQQIYTVNFNNYRDTNRDNDSESRTLKEMELIHRLHKIQQDISALMPEQEALNNEAS